MKRKAHLSNEKPLNFKQQFGKPFWLLICLMIVSLGLVQGNPEPDPILYEVKIERHQPVKMRDGVILYADIYRPAKEGKYPVILTRTPYGVQRVGVHHERMGSF